MVDLGVGQGLRTLSVWCLVLSSQQSRRGSEPVSLVNSATSTVRKPPGLLEAACC